MYKRFQGEDAAFFGAAIGLNDIQRYETALFLGGTCETSINTVCWGDSDCTAGTGPCKLPDFTDFPIELSVDAQNPEHACGSDSVACQGNFWDLEECPGFDKTKVKSVNGMSVSFVTDSFAYLEPIAGLPLGELSANCGDFE